MGKIHPTYKKVLVEEFVDNITANSSQYYAFASHPIEIEGSAPDVPNNDYDSVFTFNWNILFGKKIKGNDVVPAISKNIWTANTVYEMYDNTSNTIYSNNIFYAITEPSITGGFYYIYKCIDNANGSPSTIDPSSIGTPTQPSTFTTDDGYKWRYISKISTANYEKFSSAEYAPVYTDAAISASAMNYAGVDVVMISNAGSGYIAYRNNPNTDIIQSNPNTTLIQIASDASDSDNFYVNSAIYIYNTLETTSQLRIISDYVVNSSGKFVFTETGVNTSLITPGLTKYLISPAVIFESDGDSEPSAYATVNTSTYAISEIVMLNSGSNISWANVSIRAGYGSGANVYAIVPPPGGHGYDAVSELNVKGLAVSFSFSNNEYNTLPTANIVYNKIGMVKNPYTLVANTADGTATKGTIYNTATFDNLYVVNVIPSYTFSKGETIIGANSGSRGVVVFSNSSQAYIACDQTFIDGEYVANTAGDNLTTIAIQTTPDIYTKDLKMIYSENINNINRSNTQTESYKLIIEI